jgi:hypothetical protein
VKPEFVRRLKVLVAEENCLLVEVLERALDVYERENNKH